MQKTTNKPSENLVRGKDDGNDGGAFLLILWLRHRISKANNIV